MSTRYDLASAYIMSQWMLETTTTQKLLCRMMPELCKASAYKLVSVFGVKSEEMLRQHLSVDESGYEATAWFASEASTDLRAALTRLERDRGGRPHVAIIKTKSVVQVLQIQHNQVFRYDASTTELEQLPDIPSLPSDASATLLSRSECSTVPLIIEQPFRLASALQFAQEIQMDCGADWFRTMRLLLQSADPPARPFDMLDEASVHELLSSSPDLACSWTIERTIDRVAQSLEQMPQACSVMVLEIVLETCTRDGDILVHFVVTRPSATQWLAFRQGYFASSFSSLRHSAHIARLLDANDIRFRRATVALLHPPLHSRPSPAVYSPLVLLDAIVGVEAPVMPPESGVINRARDALVRYSGVAADAIHRERITYDGLFPKLAAMLSSSDDVDNQKRFIVVELLAHETSEPCVIFAVSSVSSLWCLCFARTPSTVTKLYWRKTTTQDLSRVLGVSITLEYRAVVSWLHRASAAEGSGKLAISNAPSNNVTRASLLLEQLLERKLLYDLELKPDGTYGSELYPEGQSVSLEKGSKEFFVRLRGDDPATRMMRSRSSILPPDDPLLCVGNLLWPPPVTAHGVGFDLLAAEELAFPRDPLAESRANNFFGIRRVCIRDRDFVDEALLRQYLSEPGSTVILQSLCGSGKTKAAVDLAHGMHERGELLPGGMIVLGDRVAMLSAVKHKFDERDRSCKVCKRPTKRRRSAQTDQELRSLPQIKQHMNVGLYWLMNRNRQPLHSRPYLIITPHQLVRFGLPDAQGGAPVPKPALLNVEEVTSLARTMVSPILNKSSGMERKRIILNTRLMLRDTQARLLTSDAFVDDSVIHLVRAHRDISKTVLLQFSKKQTAASRPVLIIFDQVFAREIMLAEQHAGKNLFVVDDTKEHLNVMYELARRNASVLPDETPEQRERRLDDQMGCITSDTPDRRTHMLNFPAYCRARTWLGITPAVQHGSDYDGDHFQVGVGFVSGKSVCMRDVVQMLWRVRKLQRLYLFVRPDPPGQPPPQLPTSLERLQAALDANIALEAGRPTPWAEVGEILGSIDVNPVTRRADLQQHQRDEFVQTLWLHSTREHNESRNDRLGWLLAYLHAQGATVYIARPGASISTETRQMHNLIDQEALVALQDRTVASFLHADNLSTQEWESRRQAPPQDGVRDPALAKHETLRKLGLADSCQVTPEAPPQSDFFARRFALNNGRNVAAIQRFSRLFVQHGDLLDAFRLGSQDDCPDMLAVERPQRTERELLLRLMKAASVQSWSSRQEYEVIRGSDAPALEATTRKWLKDAEGPLRLTFPSLANKAALPTNQAQLWNWLQTVLEREYAVGVHAQPFKFQNQWYVRRCIDASEPLEWTVYLCALGRLRPDVPALEQALRDVHATHLRWSEYHHLDRPGVPQDGTLRPLQELIHRDTLRQVLARAPLPSQLPVTTSTTAAEDEFVED